MLLHRLPAVLNSTVSVFSLYLSMSKVALALKGDTADMAAMGQINTSCELIFYTAKMNNLIRVDENSIENVLLHILFNVVDSIVQHCYT